MNVTILLRKLIDIEKSIGKETRATILEKLFDAENCLLLMQREMIEIRTESNALRYHYRKRGSSLPIYYLQL